MMAGQRRGARLRAAGLLAGLALVLAACGGGSGGSGAGGSSAGGGEGGLTELGKTLPAAIQSSREIKVGSDIAYAPVEFYENGNEVRGIDPDLAAALGDKLGVKFTFVNTTFDGIIPALKSKRFDVIMSAMSVTDEREKEISFVSYFNAGTSILVKKGNPQGIQSLDDLCGKTIALQRGTTQEEVAKEQTAKCQSAGKPMKTLSFDRDTEALLQVKSGRAVADMNDFPVAAYNAQTSGGGNDFEVVGSQIDAGPYGIGVRKEDAQLRTAVQAALKAVVADGTYDKVLTKWDVADGALKTAEVSGA
jgi:polar amino acid transport system substrate-binding protein